MKAAHKQKRPPTHNELDVIMDILRSGMPGHSSSSSASASASASSSASNAKSASASAPASAQSKAPPRLTSAEGLLVNSRGRRKQTGAAPSYQESSSGEEGDSASEASGNGSGSGIDTDSDSDSFFDDSDDDSDGDGKEHSHDVIRTAKAKLKPRAKSTSSSTSKGSSSTSGNINNTYSDANKETISSKFVAAGGGRRGRYNIDWDSLLDSIEHETGYRLNKGQVKTVHNNLMKQKAAKESGVLTGALNEEDKTAIENYVVVESGLPVGTITFTPGFWGPLAERMNRTVGQLRNTYTNIVKSMKHKELKTGPFTDEEVSSTLV